MALSKQSTVSDQFFATAINTSNMMYVMSVMTPTGRRVYGKYGQMRPQQQLTGLEDVSKVVSIVANSVTIPDSIAFYSSHEYNIKNALKIAEMSCLVICFSMCAINSNGVYFLYSNILCLSLHKRAGLVVVRMVSLSLSLAPNRV